MMRIIQVVAASVVGVAALAGAGETQAREYPWCAILTDRDGSAENCGFVSYQQCAAYLSGIGGYCQPNPAYSLARERDDRRRSRDDDDDDR
jgi:hypothetical protein